MQGLDLSKLNPDWMESILISGLPIPPSDNGQYKTIIRRTKEGKFKTLRAPSKTANTYKKIFSDWVIVNMQSMVKARSAIKLWNSAMELRLYIAMHEDKLITAQKTIKRMDAQNRDKALTDLLSAALQVDDSLFVITTQEKVIAAPGGEQVIAILTPKKIRTLAEVFQALEVRSI